MPQPPNEHVERYLKRLEHGQFRVFDRADGNAGSFEMSASELALILEGIDLRGAKRRASHDDVMRRVSTRLPYSQRDSSPMLLR